MKENEQSLKDLQNTIKYTNIQMMGIPGEKREKGAEGISEEVLAEVFHNFM